MASDGTTEVAHSLDRIAQALRGLEDTFDVALILGVVWFVSRLGGCL